MNQPNDFRVKGARLVYWLALGVTAPRLPWRADPCSFAT